MAMRHPSARQAVG